MLLLQKVFLCSFLVLLFPQAQNGNKQELNDQFFEAVRKGDAAAVTAALDKGADVNAKFRYGATALFKAAERGHTDVVKILLERGADTTVKDTFYNATAMTWALDGKHVDVVRLLLQKNGDDAENVLMEGVRENNDELVKIALEKGGIKPEPLTAALALTSADPERAAAVEMLKKAGAVPPLEVDAATLQSYTGKYRSETGTELTIVVNEGRLVGKTIGRPDLVLMALDKTTFRPPAFGGVTLTFNPEGGKVTSLTFKQGPNTTQWKRVD